jgi:hypothetical protein
MSHPFNLGINQIIGFEVQSSAEWRREKAQRFPDDYRNLKAAEELERLAQEINDLGGSEIHRRIDELVGLARDFDGSAVIETFSTTVSYELRSIGFHSSYESGTKFLEWYRDNLEKLLRDHINEDDSTIAAPDLDEQVENDPAVKAAKQRYDEAPCQGLCRSPQATVTVRAVERPPENHLRW